MPAFPRPRVAAPAIVSPGASAPPSAPDRQPWVSRDDQDALPRACAGGLAAVVACLIAASLFGSLCEHGVIRLPRPEWGGKLARLFDVDREANVPTWYSSSAFLVCAVLFGGIGRLQRRERSPWYRHWVGLAVLFVLLSLDEAVSLHERSIGPLHEALDTGGYLYFDWVIPGGCFVMMLALVYRRFLGAMAARIRRLFLVSAALFLSGAIGMELVGGRHFELYGGDDLAYALITLVEELLEMSGVVVLIYALLRVRASPVCRPQPPLET